MTKRHATAITSHHHALAQALEIILATFLDHLRALPGHFVTSMLGNSPGTHETWEPRLSDYIERVIRNVIVETYMSVRGTALQGLFPLPEDWERQVAENDVLITEFLERPVNKTAGRDMCRLRIRPLG
jgi:hypothetical protein